MPYAMTVFGSELIDQCFRYHAATLGEALLGAKRRLVGFGPNGSGATGWDSRRLVMDALAKAVSPKGSDLAAERLEHLALFNLIGDPLLTLHFPRETQIAAQQSARAGDQILISGTSPCSGDCTVELVADQDADDSCKQRSHFDPSADALADYQHIYEQANRPPLSSTETTVAAGHFTISLDIPPTATGRCKLRAFVAGATDCAIGSTTIEIEPSAGVK
jgi:hypothetical protein